MGLLFKKFLVNFIIFKIFPISRIFHVFWNFYSLSESVFDQFAFSSCTLCAKNYIITSVGNEYEKRNWNRTKKNSTCHQE